MWNIMLLLCLLLLLLLLFLALGIALEMNSRQSFLLSTDIIFSRVISSTHYYTNVAQQLSVHMLVVVW